MTSGSWFRLTAKNAVVHIPDSLRAERDASATPEAGLRQGTKRFALRLRRTSERETSIPPRHLYGVPRGCQVKAEKTEVRQEERGVPHEIKNDSCRELRISPNYQ
jgi:hypothetical protein